MSFNIEKIKSTKTRILEVVKPYIGENKQIEFSNHINEKLENFNPAMMVYGVYNAGKSSLINAIFGQEEFAKTSDIPQTDEITPYEYGGYTIYDTPGINAPIEHQKVTEEHLKKCELVLFVMSNVGSFEDKYVYERIADVLEQQKPILIVLNSKSGININSEDSIREINKVNQHLSTICDARGINKAEDKVDIIFVNTKFALLGKIRNQEKLIEQSNIINVENKINDMLNKSGSQEIVKTLSLYMSDYINTALSIIDEQISDYHSKNIEGLVTFLEKLKQKTLISIQNIVLDTATIITGHLVSLFLQRENKEEIERMVKDLTEELKEDINQVWETAYNEIKQKVQEMEEEFSNVDIDIEFSDMKAELQLQKASLDNEQDLNVAGSLGTVITLIPNFHPYVIPIKAVLSLVVQIFNAFLSSSESRTQAQAELEEKRAYHLAAKNQADSFVIKYKNNINREVQSSILEKFDNWIKQYRIISEKISKDDIKLKSDKKDLENINRELLVVLSK